MSVLSLQLLPFLPADDQIVVVDVGARGATEESKWRFLGDRLVLYGFEPDADECARLNAVAKAEGLPHHYYPTCLAESDAAKRPFYILKKIDTVSLYPPAEKRMARWRMRLALEPHRTFEALEYLHLVCTTEIATRSLDSWHAEIGRPEIDFLKLDVQGAELDVLKGAQGTLASVLGVDA